MKWKPAALAAAAALLLGQLMVGPFRQGWSQMRTDFPNHYTAAVLTLRHQPLRVFYDWEWFQRQIVYSGIERQLGGYTPYTPLTMLPMLPLAKLPPQRAKQAWLVLELAFLAASVWVLSRATGFGFLAVLVLALLSHGSIASNFALGHYYIFLLLLLSGAAWCLLRGREFAGGVFLGLIFAFKLYTAPFALYFLARRQWRAFWGMSCTIAAAALAAIALFGAGDTWFFATSVMPAGLDGAVVDPYNPGLGSMTVLLRRLFVPEAELNPHPLLPFPPAFFFLRTLFILGILVLSLLAVARVKEAEPRAFAWFALVIFALSPVTASSHYVLMLAPVAILLRGASMPWAAGLIAMYALIEPTLRPWDAWWFPKLWLALALAGYAGWPYLRALRARQALPVVAIAVVVSIGVAWRRWTVYQTEPPQTAEHVDVRPGALFSSAPAIRSAGMVYESMEEDRFGLRAAGGSGHWFFGFTGHAFHPSVPAAGGPVYFELVSGGHSRVGVLSGAGDPLEFAGSSEPDPTDPAVSPDGGRLAFVTGESLVLSDHGRRSVIAGGKISGPAFFSGQERLVFAEGSPGRRAIFSVSLAGGPMEKLTELGDCFEPAVSPDDRMLAFTCSETGGRQIWVQSLDTRQLRQITRGACRNDAPAWDPDGRSLVFASDCERGFGLSALYRVRIR